MKEELKLHWKYDNALMIVNVMKSTKHSKRDLHIIDLRLGKKNEYILEVDAIVLHFVYTPQVSASEVSFLWAFAGSGFCSSPIFRSEKECLRWEPEAFLISGPKRPIFLLH